MVILFELEDKAAAPPATFDTSVLAQPPFLGHKEILPQINHNPPLQKL
jgi:hypothetical protein